MPPSTDKTSLHLPDRHGTSIARYHQHQGQSNDCGPHVVSMAINYWHGYAEGDASRLHGDATAQQMNRVRWRGPLPIVRRVPNWATFPWGMVDVLRQHGIPARWRLFARPDDLAAGLAAGRLLMPIFGEPLKFKNRRWRGWSHVVLLVGLDGDDVILVDSSASYAPSRLPRETFMRRWGNTLRLLVETTDETQ